MRVLTKKYIVNRYQLYTTAKRSLEAFVAEVENSNWEKHNDVKLMYPSADLIAGTGKRYVFNIKGNSFRLVADIEFKKKLFFVVWFGTHADYNKLDVATIKHVKAD